MITLKPLAPCGAEITPYDRRQLALYAALLEADDAGRCWRESAAEIMRINVRADDAEACWRSHLVRARWLVGQGLESAISAFGQRSPKANSLT